MVISRIARLGLHGPHRIPETFEESYGTRGSRGIRGGKAARRKREAYRHYESERLGVPVEDIAVVHSGGQSRPLNTSAFWLPEDSDP